MVGEFMATLQSTAHLPQRVHENIVFVHSSAERDFEKRALEISFANRIRPLGVEEIHSCRVGQEVVQ
jgi:hypothetical protein